MTTVAWFGASTITSCVTADYRMYVDEGVFHFIVGNAGKLDALVVSEKVPPLIFRPSAVRP